MGIRKTQTWENPFGGWTTVTNTAQTGHIQQQEERDQFNKSDKTCYAALLNFNYSDYHQTLEDRTFLFRERSS